MKNLLIIGFLLIGFTFHAQESGIKTQQSSKSVKHNRPNLSPEQMAELMTKKMTLSLNLDSKQQADVMMVNLDVAKKRAEMKKNRENMKSLSDSQKFEMKKAMLDEKIAFKNRMKSILNEEQFAKWEKNMAQRGGRKMQKRSGDRN